MRDRTVPKSLDVQRTNAKMLPGAKDRMRRLRSRKLSDTARPNRTRFSMRFSSHKSSTVVRSLAATSFVEWFWEVGTSLFMDQRRCCSAGYGLRQEPPSQFFFARMLSVFSTLFDRAQNASIHRLHEAQRSGQIKNFIFPYLGQLDKALPNPPADLVRREEAHAYPTNFNAMSPDWIDRLSLRGEQLTLCLARAYIPHLISQPTVLESRLRT